MIPRHSPLKTDRMLGNCSEERSKHVISIAKKSMAVAVVVLLALPVGVQAAAVSSAVNGGMTFATSTNGLIETVAQVTTKKKVVVQKKAVVKGPVVQKKTVVKRPVVVQKKTVVKQPVVVKKTVVRRAPRVVVVRPWYSRPHYGTFVAGVALGTIIAVSAVGVVPYAPADNLCWYWTSPAKINGYWDYC